MCWLFFYIFITLVIDFNGWSCTQISHTVISLRTRSGRTSIDIFPYTPPSLKLKSIKLFPPIGTVLQQPLLQKKNARLIAKHGRCGDLMASRAVCVQALAGKLPCALRQLRCPTLIESLSARRVRQWVLSNLLLVKR